MHLGDVPTSSACGREEGDALLQLNRKILRNNSGQTREQKLFVVLSCVQNEYIPALVVVFSLKNQEFSLLAKFSKFPLHSSGILRNTIEGCWI